jgi:hypothetical protein
VGRGERLTLFQVFDLDVVLAQRPIKLRQIGLQAIKSSVQITLNTIYLCIQVVDLAAKFQSKFPYVLPIEKIPNQDEKDRDYEPPDLNPRLCVHGVNFILCRLISLFGWCFQSAGKGGPLR